ncbi:unnamed protein product [Lupinus luteus]|uniref:Uncharacterized protein n=1 Tax=Lupinus luteus TaxID=3873 RepID=A0AAV1Y4P2_LUPLU
MSQFCREATHSTTLQWRFKHRVSVLRRSLLRFLHSFMICSGRKHTNSTYLMLQSHAALPSPPPQPPIDFSDEASLEALPVALPPPLFNTHDLDSDLVSLKITLLGDCQIGKTSFLVKYVGDVKDQQGRQGKGPNQMDKILDVRGARISYCIWEVQGDGKSEEQIPMACKDSTAIPVLIGTKFDDFIQLPIDLQWTIASQARAYAKALNATLFFSSATYNINVNKIFKFITAKLFDLPWTVERNLTVGEPIIDF